jgi:hypothetical protein
MMGSGDAMAKANEAFSEVLAYNGSPAYKAMAVFLSRLADYHVAEMLEAESGKSRKDHQRSARTVDAIAVAMKEGNQSRGFVA